MGQPGGGEGATAAVFGNDLLNCGLIGLCRSCSEGERDGTEAELKQPIAPPRLAIIIPLRCCAGEDLDLTVVQTEAAIDRRDLQFDGAFVRQEQARRATLDDGRSD